MIIVTPSIVIDVLGLRDTSIGWVNGDGIVIRSNGFIELTGLYILVSQYPLVSGVVQIKRGNINQKLAEKMSSIDFGFS